jgi:hypothetical protein
MPDRDHRSGTAMKRNAAWINALDPPHPHVVYHLCGVIPGVDPDEDTASIYVGVTSNLRHRLRAHSRKWWWTAVVPELCEFGPYLTRAEAEDAEKASIRFYQPAMNRAGRLLVVGP